jgi:hypothetical protein
MTINDPEILAEITQIFACYEKALAENDTAALDGLFRDAPETVRYGVGENLYGAAEIAAFRQNRVGGSPPREVLRTAIATYGSDFATTNIEFRRIGGDVIGRQSQSWIRTNEGWRIVSAHISLMGKKEG